MILANAVFFRERGAIIIKLTLRGGLALPFMFCPGGFYHRAFFGSPKGGLCQLSVSVRARPAFFLEMDGWNVRTVDNLCRFASILIYATGSRKLNN